MNIIWLQLQVCKHNSIFVHFDLAGNTDSIPQTAVEFNAAISADQQIPLEYNKAYITNSANHQLPTRPRHQLQWTKFPWNTMRLTQQI